MTALQRIELIFALTENVMATVGDFEISTFHHFTQDKDELVPYWDVILRPMDKRIYFLPTIMKCIDDLNMDLSVYTDVGRPGCIIIH